MLVAQSDRHLLLEIPGSVCAAHMPAMTAVPGFLPHRLCLSLEQLQQDQQYNAITCWYFDSCTWGDGLLGVWQACADIAIEEVPV